MEDDKQELEEIQVEFSEEEYQQVEEAAKQMGMSIDEFVVYALEKYLEKFEHEDL